MGHAKDVLVLAPGGQDPLPLPGPAQRCNLIPEARRALELQPLGRRPHLRLQLPDHLAVPALQEQPDLLDHLAILLRRHQGLTGSQAAPQVIFQTARAPGDAAARAQRKRPVDQGQQVPHRPRRHVGPEVERAVAPDPADHLQRRKRVPQIQPDERIMFVVAEDDVVAGAPFLDQVAFQDQRLQLVRGQQILHLGDLRHHGAEPLGVVAEIPLAEVGLHPFPQRDRLAHVEQRALGVGKQVHAGRVGEAPDLLVQVHPIPTPLQRDRTVAQLSGPVKTWRAFGLDFLGRLGY